MKAIDLSGKVSKSYNSILMIKITSVSDGVNLLSSVLKYLAHFGLWHLRLSLNFGFDEKIISVLSNDVSHNFYI